VNPYLYVSNDPLSYIDPSGLGKIGGIVRLVKVIGERTVHIARVSFDRAVDLRRKEANIAATPEALAQKIERTAHPKGELIRHEPHKKGYRPHYQTKGKRGHTFFGGLVIPGANLGDIVGRKTGSELLGEAINFVNPLSDVQDVLDTLDYLTGGENEED